MTNWSHELKHDGGAMPVPRETVCAVKTDGHPSFTGSRAAKYWDWFKIESYKIPMEDYLRETGMPDWGEVKSDWLAQDADGTWFSFSGKPYLSVEGGEWDGPTTNYESQRTVLGNWQDAIFRRPKSEVDGGPYDWCHVGAPVYDKISGYVFEIVRVTEDSGVLLASGAWRCRTELAPYYEPDQLNKHDPLDDGYVPVPEYTDDHADDSQDTNRPGKYDVEINKLREALEAMLASHRTSGMSNGAIRAAESQARQALKGESKAMTEWSHEIAHDGGAMPVAVRTLVHLPKENGEIHYAENIQWCNVTSYKISMSDYRRETGMPEWDECPGLTKILVQESNGRWFAGPFDIAKPNVGWIGHPIIPGFDFTYMGAGQVLGSWQDAIFRRPESESNPEERLREFVRKAQGDEPDQLNKHDPLDDGYVPVPEYTDDHADGPQDTNRPGKYDVEILPNLYVDIYDVLYAFGVTNPGDQHALKKMLKPGQRGAKDAAQDRREAIASLERAIDLEGGE